MGGMSHRFYGELKNIREIYLTFFLKQGMSSVPEKIDSTVPGNSPTVELRAGIGRRRGGEGGWMGGWVVGEVIDRGECDRALSQSSRKIVYAPYLPLVEISAGATGPARREQCGGSALRRRTGGGG